MDLNINLSKMTGRKNQIKTGLCIIKVLQQIIPNTVLKMKILIYWFESHFLIYFYIVLKKN